MDTHAFYMRRCIALGHEAKAKGDNPVGAILVKDHRIAAESIVASKTTKDVTRRPYSSKACWKRNAAPYIHNFTRKRTIPGALFSWQSIVVV